MVGQPLTSTLGITGKGDMKILLRIITGCLAGWLWIALPAVSMATEASRPIQAEVIITEFPRFLAKQATDTPVVLLPSIGLKKEPGDCTWLI